jgi:hypothetical protein
LISCCRPINGPRSHSLNFEFRFKSSLPLAPTINSTPQDPSVLLTIAPFRKPHQCCLCVCRRRGNTASAKCQCPMGCVRFGRARIKLAEATISHAVFTILERDVHDRRTVERQVVPVWTVAFKYEATLIQRLKLEKRKCANLRLSPSSPRLLWLFWYPPWPNRATGSGIRLVTI